MTQLVQDVEALLYLGKGPLLYDADMFIGGLGKGLCHADMFIGLGKEPTLLSC